MLKDGQLSGERIKEIAIKDWKMEDFYGRTEDRIKDDTDVGG